MPAPRLLPRRRLTLALLAATAAAPAQTRDPVLAESLYRTGKQLYDQKHYAEACPKLAESDRLDPAGGTALLLGLCLEQAGLLASAVAALSDAQARARRDRRSDRENLARTHLAALEPRVPRLVIDVPAAVRSTPGLQVRRAGVVVPPVSYGVVLLTDPGPVEVAAEAPDHEPFRASVTARPGDTVSVTVAPLRPRPSAPPSAASSSASSPSPLLPARPGPLRPLAYGLAGAGAVVLGLGAYFGVKTLTGASTVRDRCGDASTCSDRAAVDLARTADQHATAANILLPAGGAALAAGVVLYLLTSPPSPPTASRWHLLPLPGPGLLAHGTF